MAAQDGDAMTYLRLPFFWLGLLAMAVHERLFSVYCHDCGARSSFPVPKDWAYQTTHDGTGALLCHNCRDTGTGREPWMMF